MSAGVAPPGDIALPKDEPHSPDASHFATETPAAPLAPWRLLTFRQLNVLAVAVVLSASGMVCAEYFAFVVFSVAYLYFISKIAFPPISAVSPPPVYGRNNKILGLYVLVGAVIGLFLPIAYIFGCVLEGDNEGVKAAAPHVFLLSSQVFMEGVSFSGGFSLPVRVFVPVFYNSIRISCILEWIWTELSRGGEGFEGSSWRLYLGQALTFANMAFWSFNLFGFLLPFYLPKAFKLYYSNSKFKD